MQRVYSSYHILYAYKYNIYNIYIKIYPFIYIYVFIGICILKMKHVNLKSINLHIHIHTITHIYIYLCAHSTLSKTCPWSFTFCAMSLSDQCSGQTASIPWHIKDDKCLVCHITTTSGGASEKTLKSVADVLCDITKTRGVTEVRMTDYSLQQLMKASSKIFTLALLCFPVNLMVNVF